MEIQSFDPSDEDAVVRLWQECGLTRPWNDPRKDIERKLSEQPELFLVGKVAGDVIATAMAGFDGHRGSVYYLAVAPEFQHRSCGRRLMDEVERRLVARGCPKVNLLVRTVNRDVMDFYRRLGYAQNEVLSLGKRLVED